MDTKQALNVLIRKNYVRVTEKLALAVAEVAEQIREKMKELDIRELYVPDVGTLTRWAVHSNSGFSQGCLGFKQDYEASGDLTEACVKGKDGDGHYFMNDFNCWINYATKDDFIRFAINIDKILEALSEKENEFVNKAEEALKKIDEVK